MRSWPRAWVVVALGLSGIVGLGIFGCGADLLAPQPPDDLQLYLLLSPMPADDSTSFQPAFLLRQSDPLSLEYATADHFSVTRVSDGRAFAVRHMDKSGSVFERSLSLSPSHANYIIPQQVPDSLDLHDLESGVRYEVRVRVDGRLITGTTRVPGRIELSVEHRPDGRYVVWPPTEGAAGYRLRVVRGVNGRTLLREFMTDTCLRLPSGAQEVRIEAFDANAFHYLAEDPRVISAGIDGAAGLFGSVVRARLRLDE